MNSPAEPWRHTLDHPAMRTWNARLELDFQRTARGTVLSRNRRQGPLYVQKPFYPEGADLAHVLLLHPPGGMVSGDTLELEMTLAQDAGALLTTPGAGRMYRMRPDGLVQTQRNHLRVAKGASLEWLPLETIVYPKARVRGRTAFELEAGASLFAWEVCCLGLPASHAQFDEGELDQTFSVHCEGRLHLKERILIDNNSRELMEATVAWQSQPVVGLFLGGPWPEPLSEQAMDTLRAHCEALPSSHLATVTEIEGFVLARYLGPCSEQARNLFARLWTLLRPGLLGRAACPPRIWRT